VELEARWMQQGSQLRILSFVRGGSGKDSEKREGRNSKGGSKNHKEEDITIVRAITSWTGEKC
jgi:hypothetical protein